MHEMSKPAFLGKLRNGDNLHEMSHPVYWKKQEKCFNMSSAKFFKPRVLRVKSELADAFFPLLL